jgi:hypothetical protein
LQFLQKKDYKYSCKTCFASYSLGKVIARLEQPGFCGCAAAIGVGLLSIGEGGAEGIAKHFEVHFARLGRRGSLLMQID